MFMNALWTEGTAVPYSVKFTLLPVQQVWSPYSGPAGPWDEEGLIPYARTITGICKSTCHLTLVYSRYRRRTSACQDVASDAGPLAVTRVFRTPLGFNSSMPYNYENYPYANLGLGWSLDWPWMGANYLHVSGGQGYKIVFVNNVFENHQGQQFKLVQNANGTYTLYDASRTIYQFNSAKQLIRITDRTNNNQITISYSSSRISVITDTVGRTITFGYDASSRVSSLNAAGRIWTYGYNSNGDLVSVQDPLGRITSYQYTSPYSNYLLTKVTYSTGAYSTYNYTQMVGGTEYQTSRVNQQVVYLQTGSLVRQTSFSYVVDSTYNVISSTLTLSNGTAVQGYVNYSFSLSNATTITENAQAQAARKTIDQYNAYGQIGITTVYPDGTSTSYKNYYNYDNWGNTIYERDAINASVYRETFYSYANTNTQNKFVNFYGNTVTNFTNSFYSNSLDSNIHDRLVGRAEFQNGAGSNRIESYYQYDTAGNLLNEKDLLASNWLTTSYTYDSYGNMLTRTDEGQPDNLSVLANSVPVRLSDPVQ